MVSVRINISRQFRSPVKGTDVTGTFLDRDKRDTVYDLVYLSAGREKKKRKYLKRKKATTDPFPKINPRSDNTVLHLREIPTPDGLFSFSFLFFFFCSHSNSAERLCDLI